jgi:uncharacterized Zn finger protein (UPF0148 family)
LRALAEVSMPTRQEAERIAEALRAAVSTVSEHSDRAMELVETRNALLAQAVDLHAKHGDMTCPVCGKRGLDDSWHARAVRAEATALLAEREDARAPSAQQLAKWTELKQRAQAQADVTRTVQAAANWLRNNVTALRNKQFVLPCQGDRSETHVAFLAQHPPYGSRAVGEWLLPTVESSCAPTSTASRGWRSHATHTWRSKRCGQVVNLRPIGEIEPWVAGIQPAQRLGPCFSTTTPTGSLAGQM